MLTIEQAIILAARAHEGQRDKAGLPYIFHPLRVMEACQQPTAKIVAVLHDVAEDTEIKLPDLAECFPHRPDILVALKALTHWHGESYQQYIFGIGVNPLATTVKLADLADNMNLSRLPEPITNVDRARHQKYQQATDFLHVRPQYTELF